MKKESININVFRFNPFAENIVDIFEEEYGQVDFGVDKKKSIIYLILMYDLNSPLIKQYPDIIERRLKIAELAEFPKKKNVFVQEYEDLMVGDNENFNKASYQYIRSFGSPEFIALQMFWKYFGEQYVNSSKIYSQKDYKESIANIKSLLIDINNLTDEIFSGKESINMRMALYKGMEKDIKMPRPEAIAMAENLDELILNPYGDYKPEELKFKSNK